MITNEPSASEKPANQWFEFKSKLVGGKIIKLNLESYLWVNIWLIFLSVKNLPFTKSKTLFNPSECVKTYLTEFLFFKLKTEP